MSKAEPGALFREVFGNPWPGEAELFFKTDWTSEEKGIVQVYFRSADNQGKSFSDMYQALCDLDVGLEPSVQRRAAANFINAMLPTMAHLETPSSVITELVRHVDILPGLPVLGIVEVAEILSDCRTGCFVRGIDTSLRSHAELEHFTKTHEQAMSFYISAVLRDDIKAIDHLNALPAMRDLVSDSDIRGICASVDRYPDVFPAEASSYFEKLPRIVHVRDRYIAAAPVSVYLKNLKTAIRKGSSQALEDCFDSSLSLRCGPALITEILNMYEQENRTQTQKQTNQMVKACVIKLIEAGVDAYPAYLETVHGRFGALDFIDSPPSRGEIMDHCLAKRKEGEQDPTVFLLMFTPKELAAHERGQELLERLHKYTQDPKLLQFMTSLQYVGKAFSNDLGL
jgi:hypothetical protein